MPNPSAINGAIPLKALINKGNKSETSLVTACIKGSIAGARPLNICFNPPKISVMFKLLNSSINGLNASAISVMISFIDRKPSYYANKKGLLL